MKLHNNEFKSHLNGLKVIKVFTLYNKYNDN